MANAARARRRPGVHPILGFDIGALHHEVLYRSKKAAVCRV
jgi:hypothetical protein